MLATVKHEVTLKRSCQKSSQGMDRSNALLMWPPSSHTQKWAYLEECTSLVCSGSFYIKYLLSTLCLVYDDGFIAMFSVVMDADGKWPMTWAKQAYSAT